MTTLILIRHGHTDWADKKLAGWLPDVHLNELGRQQAQDLVARLQPIELAAIYSSPLERTIETAQPIAKARGLKISKVPNLGEVKCGDWQGQSLKVLAQKKEWKSVQASPSTFVFPNGESFRAMQSRAVAAVEQIIAAHETGAVALFSHGDVIKVIVAYYSGIALDNFQRIAISPASISVIAIGPFGARIDRLNDTGPFQAPPPNGPHAKGKLLLSLTPDPSPENDPSTSLRTQFSGEGTQRGPLPLSRNHLACPALFCGVDFGRGGRGVRLSSHKGKEQ